MNNELFNILTKLNEKLSIEELYEINKLISNISDEEIFNLINSSSYKIFDKDIDILIEIIEKLKYFNLENNELLDKINKQLKLNLL